MNKQLRIEIEPCGIGTYMRLAGQDNSIEFGKWLPGPNGVQVFIPSPEGSRGLDPGSPVGMILLSIPPGVVSSVIGAWIWSHMKDRPRKIKINRTEVQFDEGEITKVIQENIEADL
jgi:hypothetical protein